MVNRKDGTRAYPKVERKEGFIMGVKLSITSREEVLSFVESRLESKEQFYIVTPNPENLLLATRDSVLKKIIRRSTLSIPDGIGLKFAYKFLFRQDLNIIKGRKLFLDLIKLASEKHLRIYLFGGQYEEQLKAKEILEKQYKNVTFKTNFKFPQYDRNGSPLSAEDRKLHKSVIGDIKLFDPDLIFVAMNTPKQEKWIYKNFYNLISVTGAMAVGGTFDYIAGNMKLPPKWMESLGLEWLYRLVQELRRIKRIFNAVIVFPLRIITWKLWKK